MSKTILSGLADGAAVNNYPVQQAGMNQRPRRGPPAIAPVSHFFNNPAAID
jgi:hypothetical protein